mmetsp:Transcript_27311/g.80334  ORF Transcript_27311/g.80334 Transcript_27311/m.80334 type:complete len:301 (+) Transcript_27311:227-1129(+)
MRQTLGSVGGVRKAMNAPSAARQVTAPPARGQRPRSLGAVRAKHALEAFDVSIARRRVVVACGARLGGRWALRGRLHRGWSRRLARAGGVRGGRRRRGRRLVVEAARGSLGAGALGPRARLVRARAARSPSLLHALAQRGEEIVVLHHLFVHEEFVADLVETFRLGLDAFLLLALLLVPGHLSPVEQAAGRGGRDDTADRLLGARQLAGLAVKADFNAALGLFWRSGTCSEGGGAGRGIEGRGRKATREELAAALNALHHLCALRYRDGAAAVGLERIHSNVYPGHQRCSRAGRPCSRAC